MEFELGMQLTPNLFTLFNLGNCLARTFHIIWELRVLFLLTHYKKINACCVFFL